MPGKDIYLDPLPTGWVESKANKPRIYPGFNVPGGEVNTAKVGWGDAESDAEYATDPNYQADIAGPVEQPQPDTGIVGKIQQATGWNPNLRIEQLPQVQQLQRRIGELRAAQSQPLGQRLLNTAQQVGWEIPTTAYRAGLDVLYQPQGGFKSAVNQMQQEAQATAADPNAPGILRAEKGLVAKGLQAAPVVQYGPDILSTTSGIKDIAELAGKGIAAAPKVAEAVRNPAMARQALTGAMRQAPVLDPLTKRLIPRMAGGAEEDLTSPLAQSIKAAQTGGLEKPPTTVGAVRAARPPRPSRSKVTVPTPQQIDQAIARAGGDTAPLLQQFKDVLPQMTPEQTQQSLRMLLQKDPNMFKKAGVPGLTTEAAASLTAPEGQQDVERAKNATQDAAQIVKQKRQQQKAQAFEEAGMEPPKPPEPPKPTAEGAPLDDGDQEVLRLSPHLTPDVQDSVVSGISKGLERAQTVSHIALGSAGAIYGYDQNQNDDMTHRLIKSAAYGATGLTAAHVLTGGPTSEIANRAMNAWRRQLLSPKTIVIPKLGTDVFGLPFSAMARGLSAIFERGPTASSAIGAIVGSGVGYSQSQQDPTWERILKIVGGGAAGAGIAHPEAARMFVGFALGMPDAMRAAAEAFNPQNLLAKGEMATPGQYVSSDFQRVIAAVTDGVAKMHESGVAYANAPIIAAEEAKISKAETNDTALKWLQGEVGNITQMHMVQTPEGFKDVGKLTAYQRDIMENQPEVWDAISSGQWNDPKVIDYARNAHIAQQVEDFRKTLPNPQDVAKEWTLMSDIGPFSLRPGARGKGGIVARTSHGILSKIGEAQIPLGKVTIPLGKFIAPFDKVVSNAADQFINFTPLLGAANVGLYPEMSKSMSAAKQLLGLSIFAAGYAAVGNGATDGGPTQKQAFYRWLDAGNQPYSWRGPDGLWRPIKELPVEVQPLFRAMGALNGMLRDGTLSEDPGAIGQGALKELFGALSDSSTVQSIFETANAILQGGSTWTREASFQLGGLAGSNLAVPAMGERPTTPDTSSDVMAGLKSRLPGIEQQVPPKLGPMGQPVPNPQQGWKALLGSYAGKPPLTDQVALQYVGPDGPGLENLHRSPYANLPLPKDATFSRALWQKTGSLLEENTGKVTSLPQWKAADKKKVLSSVKGFYHQQAFWDTVNTYGRDKYLAQLNPDQQSEFKADELAWQVSQQAMKTPYANTKGQPAALAKQYAEVQQRYTSAADALKKGGPKAQQLYQEAAKSKQYANANRIAAEIRSPDSMDYIKKKLLPGIKPETWQQLQSGQVALVGKPGQIPLQRQLQYYMMYRYYSALPSSDPVRQKYKQFLTNYKAAENVTKLKAETPAATAKQAEQAAA